MILGAWCTIEASPTPKVLETFKIFLKETRIYKRIKSELNSDLSDLFFVKSKCVN